MKNCVTIRIRRLGRRSASSPAQAPSSSIGPNCSAVVRPSETPLPVSSSTSHSSATVWTHVPVSETSWPATKRR
jgi:hypothetical protein